MQNTDAFLQYGAMYQHGFGSLFLAEIHGTFPDPAKQAVVRDMLEKAISLTVKAQSRDGGWRYEPQPGESDVSVAVALLTALRAAKNAGIFIDKSVVDKCVEYIKGYRLLDGGFCYQKGRRANLTLHACGPCGQQVAESTGRSRVHSRSGSSACISPVRYSANASAAKPASRPPVAANLRSNSSSAANSSRSRVAQAF